MKRHISLLFILIFSLVFTQSLFAGASHRYVDERIYGKAEIVEIQEHKVDQGQGINLVETWVFLKITSGPLEGETKKALFSGENDMPAEMTYKVGDRVYVGIAPSGVEGTAEYVSIYDIDNSTAIIVLAILLVLAIVTIPENPTETTANLQGRVIINTKKKLGRQAISLSDQYHVRHLILEEMKQVAGKEG